MNILSYTKDEMLSHLKIIDQSNLSQPKEAEKPKFLKSVVINPFVVKITSMNEYSDRHASLDIN